MKRAVRALPALLWCLPLGGAETGQEDLSTRIGEEVAARSGIATGTAQPEELVRSLACYGLLALGPSDQSRIHARYPGLIRSVAPQVGDRVEKGDALAVVESDSSLAEYAILAPIGGTVIERGANPGEHTAGREILHIASLDTLWAQLRIYPSQQEQVAPGQAVRMQAGSRRLEAAIAHLLPVPGRPWILARIPVANPQGLLSPGLLVEARVEVGRHPVALAVRNEGIQDMEGRRGVFVKRGETYTFAPLELGRSDGEHTEVLSGLAPGAAYVVRKSFLIRADIEKSHAGHGH